MRFDQRVTQSLVTFYAIALVLCSFSLTAHADLTDIQSTRIQILEGKQTYHPGPNCYNAVSYVSGFTDFLYQSSSMELKYYLAEFCTENTGAPLVGDIIIIGVPNAPFSSSFEHAMIKVDETNIFEKGATTAVFSAILNSSYVDREQAVRDTYYARKGYHESEYSKICAHSPINCRSFTCNLKKRPVSSAVKSCMDSSGASNLKLVQRELQEISFAKSQDIHSELSDLYHILNILFEDMDNLGAGDPCATYYLASWNSIYWHLSYGMELRTSESVYILKRFNEKLNGIYRNISETRKDPKSKFILSGGL